MNMDQFLYHPDKMCRDDHVTLLTPGEFILLQAEEIREYVKEHPKLSENEAAIEWIKKYGQAFRETWAPFVVKKELIPRVRAEIARHRWIESEKKKRDLGREAELDWIRKHGPGFFGQH